MTRTITRNDFQKLNALPTNDKKLNSTLENAPHQKAYDANRDGKINAKDFDKNNDGKLSGQELKKFFQYTDNYDKNGSSKSIANKGQAGTIYKAAQGASQRYRATQKSTPTKTNKTTTKPLTPQQKAAVKTALSRLQGKLSSSQLSTARQALDKMARDGSLKWLNNTHLNADQQQIVLLQQFSHPKNAGHIASLVSDKGLVPASMSKKQLHLMTSLAGVRGSAAKSLLACGFNAAKTTKLANVMLMSASFAAQFSKADNKYSFGVNALEKMDQFAKDVKNVGKGFAPVAEVNNTDVATRALQKAPWLLYSLPPKQAQSVVTGVLKEFGKGLKYKMFQADSLRKTLVSLKTDNPKMYKLMFNVAHKEVTGNPLPQWRNHAFNLVGGLFAGRVNSSLTWGFLSTADLSMSTGSSPLEALRNASLTTLVNAVGSKLLKGGNTLSALLVALQSTLEVTTDLLKNNDAQDGILGALRKKENWPVFP